MYKIFIVVFFVFFYNSEIFSKEENCPYNLTKNIIQKTFSRIKKNKEKIYSDPNYLKIIAREEILKYMDIERSALLILGKYYTLLNQENKSRYFSAFQSYLEYSYGKILKFYKNQKYAIFLERSFSNTQIVRISILDKEFITSIRFDFKWKKNLKNKDWKIYDIIIERISMIITKQGEWSQILQRKGIEGLIKYLQNSSNKKIVLK